jgi:4-hydroxybenzoate polyprenyltransferase
MSLLLFFYLFTGESLDQISRVVFPSYSLVLIAPIFDIIISGGKGIPMGYLKFDSDILFRYATFFGSFKHTDITPGIRIEVAVILVLAYFYFRYKEKPVLGSIISTLALYSLIFAFLLMLDISKMIFVMVAPLGEAYDLDFLFSIYKIIIIITSSILLYISNSDKVNILISNIRPFRTFHFCFMFIIGIMLAVVFGMEQPLFKLFLKAFFACLSIIFAFTYSVITNDISDISIDVISNKDRPLIEKKIRPKEYRNLSYFVLFFALVTAAFVDFLSVFFISLFIALYYIYSMPPLRFKRVPILSKTVISLNSLLLVIWGYYCAGMPLYEFPSNIIFYFLVPITLAINFIDIKDYEGDKHAGIKTLPTIIGLRAAKFIIGLFFILAYILIYPLFNIPIMIIPLLSFGILEAYLINKKEYREKEVFLVYLLSLINLSLLFTMFSKII